MRHCWICVLALVFSTQAAFAGTVDPPLHIHVAKLDKSILNGLLIAYTEDGFDFMDAKKQTTTVAWDALPPDVVMNLNERLLSLRKPVADDYFKLGKKLLTMPGGRAPAERAFARALHLDPKLKEQIVAARKSASVPVAPVQPTPAGLNGTKDSTTSGPSTQAGNPFDPRDPNKRVVGPQEQKGTVDPSAWGKQTPAQMAAAVANLKSFGHDASEKIGVHLTPYETQFFLLYTDIDQTDAQKWAGVLDRMYAKLSSLFGVAPGENLWHGKALVFVFSREDDYLKFEIKMHGTVASGTAGMCHTFGSGDVHIAFYRQANEMDFAHVLVHESVHGFVHRYRSPTDLPSWVNEGLAEAIATDMVRQPGMAQSGEGDARNDLQTRKSLEKFFTTDHIVAWQYPVARTLTEFMIHQSKKGYVDFINGLKDGMPWDESLRSKYGVTPEELVNAYGNSMGVAGLKTGLERAQ